MKAKLQAHICQRVQQLDDEQMLTSINKIIDLYFSLYQKVNDTTLEQRERNLNIIINLDTIHTRRIYYFLKSYANGIKQ